MRPAVFQRLFYHYIIALLRCLTKQAAVKPQTNVEDGTCRDCQQKLPTESKPAVEQRLRKQVHEQYHIGIALVHAGLTRLDA